MNNPNLRPYPAYKPSGVPCSATCRPIGRRRASKGMLPHPLSIVPAVLACYTWCEPADYLIAYEGDQICMERVFIYWDNSNLFIEAQRLAGELEEEPDARNRVRIFFDNLLYLAKADRALERAYAAGSVPPEGWPVTATQKFVAVREFRPKGKWTSLPEAALRVHLTCPGCGHYYPVFHKQCGMHVEIAIALSPNAICGVCQSNGQDGSLSVDIADCPSCALECRSTEQVFGADSVRYSGQRISKDTHGGRRPPRIKGPCATCGSHVGTETHHIDWNHDNNEKGNLSIICKHCHEQAHKLGKPLFDELVRRVSSNSSEKEALKCSSLKRYRELYGPIPEVKQPRLFD